MLQYKAERKGSIVQFIDRFYASTQTCSQCDAKTGPRGAAELNVRTWTCSNCGYIHDRDVNAATNILYQGIEEFLPQGLRDSFNYTNYKSGQYPLSYRGVPRKTSKEKF